MRILARDVVGGIETGCLNEGRTCLYPEVRLQKTFGWAPLREV
jgi:hypothetical protein